MSTLPSPQKSKLQHPLRIVPLHPHVRDAAAPAPQLTYRGGPLLHSVEVFSIFWGPAWKDAANAALIPQINSFFDFILASQLIDQLTEYDVPRHSIGKGVLLGTNTFTTSSPGTLVTDAAIQQFLQSQISATTFPAPTPNSLYFLYLPPGTQVTQGGSVSCQEFCGYHETTPTHDIFYAVMPYPGCTGCLGGLTAFNALTSTSSHELCEAITDPIPGQGWYDDNNGEIGDICAWHTKQLGNYTIQLEWSNKASACI
jgi:hypothetical protein